VKANNNVIRDVVSLQSTNLVKQKNTRVWKRILSTIVTQIKKKKRAQSGSRRSQRKEVTGIANPDGREQVRRVGVRWRERVIVV